MSEYTHNKAYFFIKCHQNYNFEAFSRLSILLIAAKTNTNSCQAWILVNFTNVAPTYSSIQYRQIVWYHLIEETHSYRHVWKFPENIFKYLYGGTFEKCELCIDTHCIEKNVQPFMGRVSLFLPHPQTSLICHFLHVWYIPWKMPPPPPFLT